MALMNNIELTFVITNFVGPSDSGPIHVVPGVQAVALTVSAVDKTVPATPVPADIFVYAREIVDPRQATDELKYRAFFTNVANPQEVQSLPAGAPVDTTTVRFRIDTVKAVCLSIAEAEFAKERIELGVRTLVKANKLMDAAFGGTPPANTSSTEVVTIA